MLSLKHCRLKLKVRYPETESNPIMRRFNQHLMPLIYMLINIRANVI